MEPGTWNLEVEPCLSRIRERVPSLLRAIDRDDARRLSREARRIVDGCVDPGRVAGRLTELELRTNVRQAADVALADELSDSELAVLRLLSTELSNREIGEELFVSVNTVKTHVRSIYGKLRARSREQAVGRAREIGLL